MAFTTVGPARMGGLAGVQKDEIVVSMDGLSNAVTASVLTRLLANIFAFLFLTAALAIAAYEVVTTQTINPYVQWILGIGIGYVLHTLGLNQGVALAPINPLPIKIQSEVVNSDNNANNNPKP